MGEVRLTPRAESDLFEIWASIAPDNIRAADKLIRGILHAAGLAAEQPQMGARRPELSATARILVHGRYVAIYEPQADGVLLVAIVHGMRDPESWLK